MVKHLPDKQTSRIASLLPVLNEAVLDFALRRFKDEQFGSLFSCDCIRYNIVDLFCFVISPRPSLL